ncbi:aldo/keto reductase [Candidatus Campylobacter infans]|uniref:Aldo/keto reductase n=1 Tax=Candidatus Campylobacter infans TaxID=2561898 RepID=A0A7H9CK58_9BACT|nr:aldo/keto reductase [Candidatus Campylobacter infans]
MNDTSEFHSKNALKSVSEICALQDTKQIQNAKRRDFVKNSGKFALASVALGAMASVSPLLANSGTNLSLAKNSSTNSNSNLTKNSGANGANSNSVASKNTTHSNKGAKMLYTTLNNGVKMPILGYGTYQIPNSEAQRCVEDALSVGYRLIDTAQAYANEQAIGEALKSAMKGGIKRDELFIETKLWISHTNEKDAFKAFETSLKKLGLDYIDLYVIHQPYNDTYGAWRAMSKLYKEGKIRAIGVSNFYADKITDFCAFNDIKPAVNQIELHPFFQKVGEQKINNDLSITVQSWASFAEGQNGIFKNELLSQIGKKYGKTPAQVILRWLIERNVIVIPKTTSIERMRENFAVFDFALSADDKAKIATLDTNKTLFIDHRDPERIKWLANYKA